MIKRESSGYLKVILSIIILLVIVGSIRFLDAEIAIKVMCFLRSFHTLHKATENIPDFLPYLVSASTLLFWIIYFYRLHAKKIDVKTQFLRLAATALPIAYILKTFFQFAFGRTGTRLWLTAKSPLIFNWFDKIGSGSFPSGHMTVFTAVGTAVLFYYPQYRWLVFLTLVLLAISLLATDYHFLSDIIAGTYLGFITTYYVWRMFEKRKVKI